MAPAIHPPCTPSASCTKGQPLRCHPSVPPCTRPEQCLARTTKLGTRPCQSAVSIMATRSLSSCGYCKKYSDGGSGRSMNTSSPRNTAQIEKYLRKKSKEAKLRKYDRLHGTHRYLKYQRSKGTPRSERECCAGKGHRGRLRRAGCRHCCAKCCSPACRQNCQECCDECCCPCCGTYCSRYCTIL